MVGAVRGVWRVGAVCAMAVLAMRREGGLLPMSRGWRVRVQRVLQMGRGVKVVVVMVRWGVLSHVAELSMMGVGDQRRIRLRAGCVVEIGRVWRVGDERGVWAQRNGARRLDPSGAE